MVQRFTQIWKGYLERMARFFSGTWRIDGVTNISGHHGSHIELLLSPLDTSYAENPFVTRALTGASGQPFRIHTSMLSRFVVGSVWNNGQLVYLPPPEKDAIKIQPAKALYFPLKLPSNLPPNWPGTLLPQSFYPMAPGNREALKNSHYAVVPVEHHSMIQFLIVPCIELLRFYFGVSSRMMTDLIRGEIGKRYADFDFENPIEDGIVKVRRKMLLTRAETLVVAQALCSETARSAMFGVHNTLAARKLKKQSLEIECKFPCDGQIALAVSGKRMKVPTSDGRAQVWVLFAMHLDSSDHLLNAIRIDIVDELMAAKPLRTEGNVVYMRQDNLSIDEESLPTFNDMLRANKRVKRVIQRIDSERFPGLKLVRIRHPKEVTVKEGDRYIPIPGEEVAAEAFTPGDGDYQTDSKKHQGVTEFITEAVGELSRVARDLDLFLDTCNLLATELKETGWYCTARTINANAVIDKPGYSRFERTPTTKWTTMYGRCRYLIVYELVNAQGHHHYLLEMELKVSQIHNGQSTALMFRTDRGPISDKDWIDYLAVCSIIGKWATFINRHHPKLGEAAVMILKRLFATINFHPIKHPRSTRLPWGMISEVAATTETRIDGGTVAIEDASEAKLRAYDPTVWAAKLQIRLLSFSIVVDE